MSRLAIVNANAKDCRDMALHIRKRDRRELVSTEGHEDVERAMRENLAVSIFSYAVRDDYGRLVCMFGAAPIEPIENNEVFGWFISAKAIRFHKREFAVKCKKLFCLFDGFAAVHNWVDSRYSKAIRWLEWLGFEKTGENISTMDKVEFVGMKKVINQEMG